MPRSKKNSTWDAIAGLTHAKQVLQEIVVWPMKRPDLFHTSTLRRPSKGVLLFGPPGTGKTLLARCIASQLQGTFFSISASSVTSKWMGDAEKLVKTLFSVARAKSPSVIFIDEIDSLLTTRSEGETDSTRRLKTEFLVQFDGASTDARENLLVIGATNRPQELDEAARRRFKKRLYIPLPCEEGRRQLIQYLLAKQENELNEDEIHQLVHQTQGYSGSDLTALCEEAAMMAVRELQPSQFDQVQIDQLRPIRFHDFTQALHQIRPSVSEKDIAFHEEWNALFGSQVMPRTNDGLK
ncbi:Fidgetin-like protein 1 [Coelomomyces lativittatus]|nr:Fidgetin-like protein 1 [Coelomomyces lativittatus]